MQFSLNVLCLLTCQKDPQTFDLETILYAVTWNVAFISCSICKRIMNKSMKKLAFTLYWFCYFQWYLCHLSCLWFKYYSASVSSFLLVYRFRRCISSNKSTQFGAFLFKKSIFGSISPMFGHISKCSMTPTWHQPVSMAGYTRESQTAKNRNYTRLPSPMSILLFVNSTATLSKCDWGISDFEPGTLRFTVQHLNRSATLQF